MLRRILCAIVAALVGTTLAVTPASAHGGGGTEYYIALGDSLAFGFQPNGDFTHGYVQQLSAKLPGLVLVNLGCPGETSTTFVAGGRCPSPHGASQFATALAFLRAHSGHVRLVTLDIGGNDVDHCVTSAGIDRACFNQGLLDIAINVSVAVARLRQVAPRVELAGM